MIIFISFTTNIFAQKRVKSRDETFKGSIDIKSIPTVTIAELEEHAAKLQGYLPGKAFADTDEYQRYQQPPADQQSRGYSR